MRLGALVVTALLGCASSKPPAPAAAPKSDDCMPLQYQSLVRGASSSSGESDAPAYDAAMDAAEGDVAAANKAAEKNDFTGAADHFVACAKRFSAVPKDDPLYETGQNATLTCYQNAALAYANGGRYATHGKPLLESAVKTHPELAKELQALLADPPADCKTPSKP